MTASTAHPASSRIRWAVLPVRNFPTALRLRSPITIRRGQLAAHQLQLLDRRISGIVDGMADGVEHEQVRAALAGLGDGPPQRRPPLADGTYPTTMVTE